MSPAAVAAGSGSRQLRQFRPDVVGVLLEVCEALLEDSRIRQSPFEALQLATSTPPRDREAEGADCPDLCRSKEQPEGETAELRVHDEFPGQR